MHPQRILGIVLVVVGVALLVVGLSSSESIVDQTSEAITGRFTDKTTWFIIGGIASAVVGVLLSLVGVNKRN